MVTRYEEDLKKSIVEMVKAGRRSDELSKIICIFKIATNVFYLFY